MNQKIPEWQTLKETLMEKDTLLDLAAINVAGTAFGFFFYQEQLAANPIQLWPFIPDSPLATLFAVLTFAFIAHDKRNNLVEALAVIGNLKYGLWTVFVLIYYHEIFYAGNPLWMYLFLLLSHVGMAAQALIILDITKTDIKAFIAASSWFIINDLVDYTLGIHTRLYTPENGPAMIAAGILTAASIIILYLRGFR
ncbi:DUF1405 domain-containing protein [Candidatus Nanohalovita haloferacivicina]|uniref:DUF1405 domain-containing protein n=1 Tax=Candidatus Nanohalovita haloferacivicina TaxID=2978046 RepID=UPI00325FC553|nr:Uncharacterized membrane protein, DUF1405 family [Candidatus Nanohalobia archaeon BNXNv]